MNTNSTQERSGKADALLKQLEQLEAAQSTPDAQPKETLSDDQPMDDTRMASIQQIEGSVRDALALFGVDYDSLISMEGETPYAQAVRSNPAVQQHVMQAENPVLEALRVAQSFQPIADFQSKYGKTPDEVRANIRKEVEAELKAKPSANEAQANKPKALAAPVFARSARQSATGGKAQGARKSLADIFNR